MQGLKAAIVPVTPFQQNCAILWDDGSKLGAVIDPGRRRRADPGDDRQTGGDGREDRAHPWPHRSRRRGGGAEGGARGSGGQGASIPIEGPDQRDLFLLEGLERQGAAYGIAGSRNVVPDRWLAEGDQVTVGGHVFDVLHTPGHTPGHVALFSPKQRFAIVGDVLFRGSVGRTDFPYGDSAALLRSISEKLFPLGDDVPFLCGHGPGSTIGLERRTNPFAGEGPSRPS